MFFKHEKLITEKWDIAQSSDFHYQNLGFMLNLIRQITRTSGRAHSAYGNHSGLFVHIIFPFQKGHYFVYSTIFSGIDDILFIVSRC